MVVVLRLPTISWFLFLLLSTWGVFFRGEQANLVSFLFAWCWTCGLRPFLHFHFVNVFFFLVSAFFPDQLGWRHDDLTPHFSGHGSKWSEGVDDGLFLPRRQCTPFSLFDSMEHTWFFFFCAAQFPVYTPYYPACDRICPNWCLFITSSADRLKFSHTGFPWRFLHLLLSDYCYIAFLLGN